MLSSLARSSLRYRISSRCLVASRLCSSSVEIPEAPVVHPLLTKRAEAMKIRFNELEKKISQGCFDQEISKEFSNLSVILDNYHKYQSEMENFSNLKEMVGQDPELSDEARDEMYEILPKVVKTANILKSRLLPQILHSDKPTIIELRPGIGGSEAGIFSNDLLEMYQNFANHMRWKWTLISKSVSNNGFLNEAILAINSPNSYDCLRHESGVHRVQRIPSTETKGRIHTSTAAVVVLPKVSEGNESSLKEDERIFKPGEIRIDTMRAGGKGGQHVNTTDSAVRITHLPTGIHVVQQDERSQPKNKAKAFSILRARLAALEREKQIQEQKKIRTEQVTTTDRSDKIRTYNYPQNRVTDHRCGFSLYDIESCMDGSKLMDIIDAVQQHELEERLQDLIDGEA